MAAGWSPAAWPRTTRSRERSQVPAPSVLYRSNTDWRPNIAFPPRCRTQWPRSSYVRDRAADFGIDASRLGVCGDSAGATLAAAACQAQARTAGPRLALQLLICPILDYSRATPSKLALTTGYLIDQATLDHDLKHYLPAGTDPSDPLVSPLLADEVTGLTRTIIHTAEFDPLRDEGRLYFERLTNAQTLKCPTLAIRV